MTEAERFSVILDELGALLVKLGYYSENIVLIGGQALAAEQVAAGEDPILQVQTDTGQTIDRGYSFDPDLLIEPLDPAESSQWDELPQLLRNAGYARTPRSFRWEKQVGEVYVRVDLFMPAGHPEPPTMMTPLPRGDKVLSRSQSMWLSVGGKGFSLRTPSIIDFVLMKLDARGLRHKVNPKDAFDLYAYVRKKTPEEVGRAIAGAPERDEALRRLKELFGLTDSVGVLEVLEFASTLDEGDRALVARDVVRTFDAVCAAGLGAGNGRK